ncbi:hypothetical protein [Micromonospora okii]|uniref:hypothetical protein n=1 Tax=Micromonospora okii TaxID=1182970 RepID=UPI001E43E0B8|nr:hypothetical protein [Micromonospora okii]
MVGVGVGAGYRLDLPPDRLGVRRFERGYADGRALPAAGGRHVEEAARLIGAVRLIGAALALWRGFGDRYDEAEILGNLGRTQRATGDGDAARATWLRALALGVETEHPAVPQLRVRLKEL